MLCSVNGQLIVFPERCTALAAPVRLGSGVCLGVLPEALGRAVHPFTPRIRTPDKTGRGEREEL